MPASVSTLTKKAATTNNKLINALPRKERRDVIKNCELVELVFEDILYHPERVIEYVYFPSDGFISLIATVDDDATLEVGLIGNEGMLGIDLILGVNTSSATALVQGAGHALRMRSECFDLIIKNNPQLHARLHRYLYVILTQLTQSTLCVSYHPLESRLARWLLMTHDRAHADHFYLKHAFLASMLGVRRSGVTIAAGGLKHQGLINYSRGHITVLNRAGLEAVSCSCYHVISSAYGKFLPQNN